MSKAEETSIQRTSGAPRHERRLDALSRLFEGGSKECTAISLINGNTLLIADNKIHEPKPKAKKKSLRRTSKSKRKEEVSLEHSNSKGMKETLIDNTMSYFATLTPQSYNADQDLKIFKELCLKRLKGEEMGYIKLNTPELEKIITHVAKNKKTNYDDEFIHNKELFTKEERAYAGSAILIARNFRTDYRKITGMLLNESPDSEMIPLIQAIRGGKKEPVKLENNAMINIDLKSQDYVQKPADDGSISPGYVILKYDKENIHAETKLIAYLIVTGALEKNKNLYIGISKKCCKGCNNFIEAVNKEYETAVRVRGTHGLQPGWLQPAILTQEGIISQEKYYSLRKSCPRLYKKQKERSLGKIHQTELSPSSGDDVSPSAPSLAKIERIRLELDTLLKAAQDGHLTLDEINALGDIIKIARQNNMQQEVGNKRPLLGSQPKKNLNADFNDAALSEENAPKKQKKEPLNDTEWWDEKQVLQALDQHCSRDVVQIMDFVTTHESLKIILNNLKDNHSTHQFLIPLHQNVLTGELDITQANHWTALHIIRDIKGEGYTVNFIDPKGNNINHEVQNIINGDINLREGIKHIFSKDSAIQHAENDHDCGPMLVYSAATVVKGGDFPDTKALTEEHSNQFGQYLRENLDREDINRMHDALRRIKNAVGDHMDTSLDTFHLKHIGKSELIAEIGETYNLKESLLAVNSNHGLLHKFDMQAIIETSVATKHIDSLPNITADKGDQKRGTTQFISENHITEHESNIQKLIDQINKGEIKPDTAIAIELKQHGENLGMKDVIGLAKIISHNEKNTTKPDERIVIPSEVTPHTILYQDAMLYKVASEKGIKVIGLEGKDLKVGKNTPEHNLNREQYMADVIYELNGKGYNVIASAGSSHTENIKQRLNDKSTRIDSSVGFGNIPRHLHGQIHEIRNSAQRTGQTTSASLTSLGSNISPIKRKTDASDKARPSLER